MSRAELVQGANALGVLRHYLRYTLIGGSEHSTIQTCVSHVLSLNF